MLITVQNLTRSAISTDVGLLGQYETLTADMSPDAIYKACKNLDPLSDAGLIRVTIAADPNIVSESPVMNLINADDLPYAPDDNQIGKFYMASNANTSPDTLYVACKNIFGESAWAKLGSPNIDIILTAADATDITVSITNVPISTPVTIETFGSADGVGVITNVSGTPVIGKNTSGTTHWATIDTPADPETSLAFKVKMATGQGATIIVSCNGQMPAVKTLWSPE